MPDCLGLEDLYVNVIYKSISTKELIVIAKIDLDSLTRPVIEDLNGNIHFIGSLVEPTTEEIMKEIQKVKKQMTKLNMIQHACNEYLLYDEDDED